MTYLFKCTFETVSGFNLSVENADIIKIEKNKNAKKSTSIWFDSSTFIILIEHLK